MASEAERLEKLKAARDALLEGKQVARVASGGRVTEFRAANLEELTSEIATLEAKAAGQAVRRPILFGFRG